MNLVAANAFRQGYSTRTFTGMEMFRYREDNVGRKVKDFSYPTSANGIDFNLKF